MVNLHLLLCNSWDSSRCNEPWLDASSLKYLRITHKPGLHGRCWAVTQHHSHLDSSLCMKAEIILYECKAATDSTLVPCVDIGNTLFWVVRWRESLSGGICLRQLQCLSWAENCCFCIWRWCQLFRMRFSNVMLCWRDTVIMATIKMEVNWLDIYCHCGRNDIQ